MINFLDFLKDRDERLFLLAMFVDDGLGGRKVDFHDYASVKQNKKIDKARDNKEKALFSL